MNGSSQPQAAGLELDFLPGEARSFQAERVGGELILREVPLAQEPRSASCSTCHVSGGHVSGAGKD